MALFNTQKSSFTKGVFVLATSLALAACNDSSTSGSPSGGDGGSGNTPPPPVTKGYVVDAPVTDASCSAYQLSGGAKGDLLGTGTSSAGSIEFGAFTYTGGALIECTGGYYTDEATNTQMDAPDMSAVVSMETGGTYVVSLLTEIAKRLAEADGNLATAITVHNQNVADNFGLDDIDITSQIPTDMNNAAAEDTSSGHYGTLLAMLSVMAADETIGGTREEMLTNFTDDLSVDNKLDFSAATVASIEAGMAAFQASGNPAASNMSTAVMDTVAESIGEGVRPVASAGDDQSVAAGAAVTLSGSGTDEDGSIASYAWSQTSGTDVTLTNAATATATFTAPSAAEASTLVFSLLVTDNQGNSSSDTVTVSVAAQAGAENQAPVASNVKITGSTGLGDTLTGSYDYSDNESDAEGVSTFKWYRGADVIDGATSKTYKIVAADQGKTLKFEVTPVASAGTATGTAVASSGTAIPAMVAENQAPVASNVKITGSTGLGDTLTGSYDYSDNESDEEGVSTFKWYRGADVIDGATSKTYKIVAADQGKTLKFEVTPVASAGTTTGVAVKSDGTAIPAADDNQAPVASNVKIMGSTGLGDTLTGSYDYSDNESDEEGVSTFKWYRGADVIDGATSKTYKIVAADQGKTLKFEVTPVASAGTTTGVAVKSDGTAIPAADDNQAPVASNVKIMGSTGLGDTLTGSYDYSDNESDEEGVSTFKWYRGADVIDGATSKTYKIVAADQGKTLKFEVTPVASAGTTTGVAVKSDGTVIPAAVSVATSENDMAASSDGSKIVFTTDNAVTGSLDGGDFSVSLNGGTPPVTVSSAVVSGDGDTTVTLTLSRALSANNSGGPGDVDGEDASVSYTESASDSNLANFSDQMVTMTEITSGPDCDACNLDDGGCPF